MEAGLNEQAVGYWQKAGEKAIRSAYAEGIAHLTAGLQLLHTLPDAPEHMQQEVALQTILGPAIIATKGLAASEVEHVYSRARELCQRLGDSPQLL
jgi:predicted ATPase